MIYLFMALGVAATPTAVVSRSPVWEGCDSPTEHCEGYILGTLDIMSQRQEICPDVSLTGRAAWAMIVRYRHEHPEARNNSIPLLAQRAFMAAFPCPERLLNSN
jgi:hypothetical protein